MVTRMRPDRTGVALVTALLVTGGLLATSIPALAWGNGSPSSVEFPNFGIHDITCDIALRSASVENGDLLTWLNDWYERNETDWGYSFDPASTRPTKTDNVNAYTDDPDSYWKDWDNHTLYLHPRSGWDPPEGDAASRVSQLYNMTRDRLYAWLMNGSVRFDADQHYAAYYAGLMSHYVMDVTQFGHTDWTRLDHNHPLDDPANGTYHEYYEALSWTDRALRTCHVDLMQRPLQEIQRVSDPARTVRDLVTYVNGRHGPDVQFQDVDMETVTLGSTYVRMLDLFVTDYDARNTWKGARGMSEELWNLTLENLWAGMDDLNNLWVSAYLDARDMFRADAADVVVEAIDLEPETGAYEGLEVNVTAQLRNVGPRATGEMSVALFVDNESVSEARADLEAGGTGAVGFFWTAVGGVHEIRVVADVYQEVPEGNETNNVRWRMVSVEEAHHDSILAVESPTLELLQDSTGRFNLTLTNTGNKPDVYRVLLDTYPGSIDFSLTLNADERVLLGPGEGVLFHIEVTTLLDNPVGPRYFTVVAEGGNSTSQQVLVVIIGERNVAPYIEVEYGFYGNVSVPMTFDASRTWDREGDNISFRWLMDNATLGTGPVLVRTFDEVGDYVIQLVASDGVNDRRETLEVSILDAIPPAPRLKLTDWDIDAARIEWRAWSSSNATKYFSEYRVYVSENNSDPDNIMAEGNVVESITLVYVDNITIIMPYDYWYSDEVHVLVTTVNIYGLVVRSNTVSYEPEIRHGFRDLYDDRLFSWLEFSWVHKFNVTKYSFEVEWRQWYPIGEGGYYQIEASQEADEIVLYFKEETITDLSDTSRLFEGLRTGYPVSFHLWYYSIDGERNWRTGIGFDLVENVPPYARVPLQITAEVGVKVPYQIISYDPDGDLKYMLIQIDWGDGSDFNPIPAGNKTVNKTYERTGTFTITVVVYDNDGDSIVLTTLAIVEEASDRPSGAWDSVTAIALIIFVALLGVIVGHLSGYYRIGREGDGKDEAKVPEKEPEPEAPPEKEPEPTAEEIVSELEEDLGEGDGDGEYFDHEPSVTELEEMIPRDGE
jgi:hypothetical protein